MTESLLKWLTIVFATLLVSTMLSMMAVFSGATGNDLNDLLDLQTVAIPVALASAIWSFARLARTGGYREATRRFWTALPGWLLFVLCLAMALVLVAELSFVLALQGTGNGRPWQEHVPAAAAFFSSVALATCYVAFRLERE